VLARCLTAVCRLCREPDVPGWVKKCGSAALRLQAVDYSVALLWLRAPARSRCGAASRRWTDRQKEKHGIFE